MAGKAVLYVRVSTDNQENGSSPQTQEADMREFASRQGWQVVGVYCDTASGVGTLSYRILHGGLGRALGMLREGTANVLLCWRFDRLARNEWDIGRIGSELQEVGARWASAQEGEKSLDDIAAVLTLILAGHTGRQERAAIKERTQRGLRARMKSGMPLNGGAPLYGYEWVIDKSVPRNLSERVGYRICDETAAVVRQIYEWTVEGTSIRQVIRRLDTQHVPTPSQWAHAQGLSFGRGESSRWSRQTVHNILHNPAYRGHLIAKRREATEYRNAEGDKRYHVKMRAVDDENAVAIAIPAIVTPETWNAAQAAVQRNRTESYRNNPNPTATLLRAGFAYCGMCGARMATADSHRGYRYYLCGVASASAHRAAECECPGKSYVVAAPAVDAEVWQEAKAMAADSERVKRMVNNRRHSGQDALQEAQRDLTWTEAQIAENEAKKARLMRDMENEDDDTMRRDIRARIVQLNDNLAQLEARRREVAERATNLDAWILHYDETLRRIFGVKDTANTKTWLIGDKYALVMLNPAPETLDSLSYADRRAVLEVLGCRVNMYPANSDYFTTHVKQWEILWNPDNQVVDTTWSSCSPG